MPIQAEYGKSYTPKTTFKMRNTSSEAIIRIKNGFIFFREVRNWTSPIQ
ncbi:hypothetical protein LCGC14_0736830 [marine sediment metagenome]|uniref:Uncharacterized protein n=1 Tax=marine sediment metagenome TaxID=412755 RepID=A0A0F9SSU1_9ZZZZ